MEVSVPLNTSNKFHMKREKTHFEPQVSLYAPYNTDQLQYTSIFLIMT
jgi:hypothetical protein